MSLAYDQLLQELDRYIELPPEQQSPYSNLQGAKHIQEIDIPVYNQPPSTESVNLDVKRYTAEGAPSEFRSNLNLQWAVCPCQWAICPHRSNTR